MKNDEKIENLEKEMEDAVLSFDYKRQGEILDKIDEIKKHKSKLNYIMKRNAVFERLMRLHGLKRLEDEFDGTPLKFKEDATPEERKKHLFAVIDHRLDGSNKVNRLHGTGLYNYLYKLDDETLAKDYQILSQHNNLLKEQLWESLNIIKDRDTQDQFYKLYLKMSGLNPKNLKIR